MKQFYKVLLGTESSACPGLHYNIDELTVAEHWNPRGKDPKEMGGFSIATDAALIRWICRGNVLYDVIIPQDAEIAYPEHPSVQGELARVNKLILTNPRPMTDDLALQFYRTSKFKHHEYYKILAVCAFCGHTKTCEAILKDHISPANARECLMHWDDFATPEQCSYPYHPELYRYIKQLLCGWADIDEQASGPIYIN